VFFGITDFWNHVPHTGRILESCTANHPAAWRTIPSGESSRYIAFERVVLNPGFTAEEGSNFEAFIRECPNCNGRPIMLNGGGSQMAMSEEQEDFSDNDFLTDVFEQNYTDDIWVYPNPTTGDIIIKMADKVDNGTIQIINGLGVVMRTEKTSGTVTSINLSDLADGIYYLVITNGEKAVCRKIVKY
jgi:hypothetical protein